MAEGTVLVTGGTGTLGRPLVDRLLADGAAVRVMSRRPRRAEDERPYAWAVADLTTGQGLDAAVEGVSVIVHCATSPRHEVACTRRLIEAAESAARRGGAALPHLVYISIVGVDRNPFFYYRAKYAAERLIATSPLPWTVLRATQFHDLLAGLVSAQRRLPVVVGAKGFRFQPVEVSEVAARLAELAQGPPAGRVPDMGGPEIYTLGELTAMAQRATGARGRYVPLPLPGKAAAAFRRGVNLCPDRAVGTVTFGDYLAAGAGAR
ncbi:NAD(P)H-binding protein [Streptomyces sp. ODS28]|uniref:SDR family oxidoreductase n=1 Tax=Streptomyces sp. ODS28 TaxID=3136688 RepID=UPI0031EC4A60